MQSSPVALLEFIKVTVASCLFLRKSMSWMEVIKKARRKLLLLGKSDYNQLLFHCHILDFLPLQMVFSVVLVLVFTFLTKNLKLISITSIPWLYCCSPKVLIFVDKCLSRCPWNTELP